MAITMQGSWTVKVKTKNAAYKQRFKIQGSDNADGTYEGKEGTPSVFVSGAQWTISIEHKPTGAVWTPSDERLTPPVSSSGQIVFDILSNDTGPDTDYNDLVLTCSIPESAWDYVVYGKVRTYGKGCTFNPCFLFHVVIDTPHQLMELLKYKEVKPVLEVMYPQRIRKFLKHKRPPIVKEPWPEPDLGPFRPMMIQTRTLPDEQRGVRQPESVETRTWSTLSTSQSGVIDPYPGTLSTGRMAEFTRAIARIKDRPKLICMTNVQPGLLLRFLEYDRTAEELAGGSYTGEGNREILGFSVSDEQGNYIFRFTPTSEAAAAESGDVVAGGQSPATQMRPDLIVQIVSGMGGEADVLFETALYSNIFNLHQLNICIPITALNPGPSACQGGRAIQAIGNIWTIPGVGNTLDPDGRITATNSNGPQIKNGAWTGNLHLFACFIDFSSPAVKYYTIRYRRPSDPLNVWSFAQEAYTHIKTSDIGLPNYTGTVVGPFFDKQLVVDGSPMKPPYYMNIESDSEWVATHRLRKIILTSSLYAPNDNPGTVEFWIEGYDDSGNKVPNAEDKIKLYIDNRPIDGDIASISMGGTAPGECAFFSLPTANEPLTIRFKVEHPGGFLQQYYLEVYRGSLTKVPVSDNIGDVQPLSLSYEDVAVAPGDLFFGTIDAVNPDTEGYVEAELQPDEGAWLPEGKTFCAFAFEIYGTYRITNGYWAGGGGRLDAELVGISYEPPSSPV